MRILVTGADGYLGSVLVPMLKGKKFSVLEADLGIFGHTKYPVNVGSCKFIDVFKKSGAGKGEGIDVVVHLAGVSNDPSSELYPELTNEMNVIASKRLIDFSAAAGVKKFIFASSASVYGSNPNLVNEKSELYPQSIYAKSKLTIENFLLDYKELNPTIFRFGTLFGVSPKMRFDLAINLMVKDAIISKKIRLFGNGEQYRPFLHVSDAARYICRAAQEVNRINGVASFALYDGVFNLAVANIKISHLAEVIASVLRADIEKIGVEHQDNRNYRMDCSKIPLFDGCISIFDGIAEVASWVMEKSAEGEFLDLDEYYTIKAWKNYMEGA